MLVTISANFIRSGESYLAVKQLLKDFVVQAIYSAANLEQQINSSNVKKNYLTNHLKKNLETLLKRFPGPQEIGGQVVDLKNINTKYPQLRTQIIAANQDVSQSKEMIVCIEKQLTQFVILKGFLDQSKPLIRKKF